MATESIVGAIGERPENWSAVTYSKYERKMCYLFSNGIRKLEKLSLYIPELKTFGDIVNLCQI